jgi:3-methyladenine DNA glycosylase AlkD
MIVLRKKLNTHYFLWQTTKTMTTPEILSELEKMGNESTRRIYENHGAPAPFFGVKVGDMKTLVKKIKKNHALALELYATGNSDAQYLAGLIADENKMTPEDLDRWANCATWYMLSDYAVASVAAEGPYGWEMGLRWIESEKDLVVSAGWMTLSGVVALRENVDIEKLGELLVRIEKIIHQSQNRSRQAMNNFIICVGAYVPPIHALAIDVAKKIGKVEVNMGNTSCQTPDAVVYIQKVLDRGAKRKKMIRC